MGKFVLGYIQGEARGQQTLFPVALDELIPADHFCRVIDAFVCRLDFQALGFERAEAAETGRPAHGDLTHLPRDAGEKFASRYLDEENSALFAFGWGLSYTSFSYSQLVVSRANVAVAEPAPGHNSVVTVGVDVKNTGSVAGTEVVQLYIRNTAASVEQPVRELKGFVRVTIAPGETKHVEFPLGFDELSFYNAEIKRTVEPTTYKIWVGGSSLTTAETSLAVVE